MILLIAIILFIIFLIYSIKPRSEEYILEGLKLSWKNKMGIEGVVDKWIVILKDKSGTTIHEYENSDAGNLKNYTDVTMNIVDNKEFDDRIIGDNTLELYYNDIKPDTKLYTKPLTFTEEDFGYIIDMSKLEEIDIPKPGSESKSGTAYTYSPGFEWGYYNDRYNDDDDGYSGQQTWFDTRKPVHTHNTSDRSRVTDFRNINTASSGQTLVNGDETYSYLWTGYFKAPSTGTYYFNTTSDDNSHMWIGPAALNPRYDNVTVNNGGLHGMQTATSAGVSLTGGEYYDFRMTFGERGSGDNLQAQWRLSTGSFTYDWSKVAFSNRQILEEFDAPETEPLPVNVDKMTNYSINHWENIYMDRQTLDCEDRAMRGFQLQTKWNCENDDVCKKQVDVNWVKPGSSGIRYKYSCSDKKEKVIFSKETSWVNNPGLSKTFAYGQNDKLNVDCDKKPITYYKLVTDSNNNWRLKYDYKCGNTTSNNCRSITTQESEASDNPAYLDRQTVKCEDDEYLSQFKLISTGVGGTNKYQYTCCK